MRVVIDTNVIISALITDISLPGYVVSLWRDNMFGVVTSQEQITELRRVSRYPKLRGRLTPALVGSLINDLYEIGILLNKLPDVSICSDPCDDYLLAMAEAGSADYLVTGDKRDLLALKHHKATRIVSVSEFLSLIRANPEGAKPSPDINP